jgi:hypothetical protein
VWRCGFQSATLQARASPGEDLCFPVMIYSTRYEHFPAHLSCVHIALFKDVKNAAELRSRIVQAATLVGTSGDAAREMVNFAFVDARLVRIVTALERR